MAEIVSQPSVFHSLFFFKKSIYQNINWYFYIRYFQTLKEYFPRRFSIPSRTPFYTFELSVYSADSLLLPSKYICKLAFSYFLSKTLSNSDNSRKSAIRPHTKMQLHACFCVGIGLGNWPRKIRRGGRERGKRKGHPWGYRGWGRGQASAGDEVNDRLLWREGSGRREMAGKKYCLLDILWRKVNSLFVVNRNPLFPEVRGEGAANSRVATSLSLVSADGGRREERRGEWWIE